MAYKHQQDGITVFRTDMHEHQLMEKRREVYNGNSKRVDPHLVTSPSLSRTYSLALSIIIWLEW